MKLNNFNPITSEKTFKVGTAHTVITPPIGFCIYYPDSKPLRSESINDDLLIRVIKMQNLTDHFLLIGLDVWGISEEFEKKIKSSINSRTNNKYGKNIFITVTGNGSSPNIFQNLEEYSIYSEYLIQLILGCEEYSNNNMRAASIGTCATRITDLTTFNDQIGSPGNPALILSVINDFEGKSIAKIINFSCPGIIYNSNHFRTSDYPGYIAWALESSGEGESIFIQGSSADIRPYDWYDSNKKRSHSNRNYQDVTAFGLLIATRLAQITNDPVQRRNVELMTEIDNETGIQVSIIGDMFLVSNPKKQSNRFSRHIMRDLPNSNIMITSGIRGQNMEEKYRFDAKGRRRAITILKNFGAK